MVENKSFSAELCKDFKFYLALTFIAITAVAVVISVADWLAWLFIQHGEFMTRMTIEILQNEAIWKTVAYMAIWIGSAMVLGTLLGKMIHMLGNEHPGDSD